MSGTTRARWLRITAWFLAVTYGLGAVFTTFAELQSGALSERLGVPSELIVISSAVQLVCAPALFVRRLAPWAALALTVITAGAIGVHWSAGEPARSIPAVLYTGLQVWFGMASRGANAAPADSPS